MSEREGRETTRAVKKRSVSLSIKRKKSKNDKETSTENPVTENQSEVQVQHVDTKKVPMMIIFKMEELTGFTQTDSNKYQIIWRRGGKKINHGKTEKKLSIIGTVELNQTVQFQCIGKQKISTGKFVEKTIALILKRENQSKKLSTISSAVLDLSSFMVPFGTTKESEKTKISFGMIDGRSINLNVEITVIPDCSREETKQEKRSRSRSRSRSIKRTSEKSSKKKKTERDNHNDDDSQVIYSETEMSDFESLTDRSDLSCTDFDDDDENVLDPFSFDNMPKVLQTLEEEDNLNKNVQLQEKRKEKNQIKHNPNCIYVHFPEDVITKEYITKNQLRIISLNDFKFTDPTKEQKRREKELKQQMKNQEHKLEISKKLDDKKLEILSLETKVYEIERKLMEINTKTILQLEEELSLTKQDHEFLQIKFNGLLKEKQDLIELIEQSNNPSNVSSSLLDNNDGESKDHDSLITKQQILNVGMKNIEIDELKNKIEILKKEIEQYEKKMKKLDETINDKQRAIIERETKYISLLSSKNQIEKENQILSSTNSSLENQIAELRNSNSSSNDKQNEEIEKLKKQIKQLQKDNEHLNEQIKNQSNNLCKKEENFQIALELSENKRHEILLLLDEQKLISEKLNEETKKQFESKRLAEIQLEQYKQETNKKISVFLEKEEEMKLKLQSYINKNEKLEEQVKRLSVGQKSSSESHKETLIQLEKYQTRSDELQRQNRTLTQQIVIVQEKNAQSYMEFENKQRKLLEAFQALSSRIQEPDEIKQNYNKEITDDEFFKCCFDMSVQFLQDKKQLDIMKQSLIEKNQLLIQQIENLKKEHQNSMILLQKNFNANTTLLFQFNKKFSKITRHFSNFFNVNEFHESSSDEDDQNNDDDYGDRFISSDNHISEKEYSNSDFPVVFAKLENNLSTLSKLTLDVVIHNKLNQDSEENEIHKKIIKFSNLISNNPNYLDDHLIDRSSNNSNSNTNTNNHHLSQNLPPISYFQLSQNFALAEIEILTQQMITENIHNVKFNENAAKKAKIICKFLKIMKNETWVKRQIQFIEEAISYAFQHTYNHIDGLVFWLSLICSILQNLQQSYNILEFTGDISKFGVLPENKLSLQKEEKSLQLLVLQIYNRIKLILFDHIDFTAKPAIFGQPTLPNQILLLQTWHNPVSPKRLLQPFCDLFYACQRSQLTPIVAKQLFVLYYWYLDAILFNELVGKSVLCSVDVALQIKSNLCILTSWNLDCKDENYRDILAEAQ